MRPQWNARERSQWNAFLFRTRSSWPEIWHSFSVPLAFPSRSFCVPAAFYLRSICVPITRSLLGYFCPVLYTVNQGCMSVFWSVTAMLGNSAVVVMVRTCPRAILLAMITLRKSTRGFPLLSHDEYGAPLGGSMRRQSSAITSAPLCRLGYN